MSSSLRRLLDAVLLTALALTFLLAGTGCRGPTPVVQQVQVIEPSGPGQPYLVLARVTNSSGGEGQVEVVSRLINRQSGEAFQATDKLELHGHERARLVARIHAPRGAYRSRVTAEYPAP